MNTLLHLKYPNQDTLTRAMVRMQEFYESPYPAIRGQVFTHETFEKLYVETHGAPFSYYEDWNGFNIPGHVVTDFFAQFYDHMTEAECQVFDFINARHLGAIMDKFYLIATHPDEPEIEHETCHAMWYLDENYKRVAHKLVRDFHSIKEDISMKLEEMLLRDGYMHAVLDDECNAYLTTTPRDWWVEQLGAWTGNQLYDAGARFRELYGKWQEPVMITVPMVDVRGHK